MGRVIRVLALALLLTLQGCASSVQTFATGVVVGTIGAVTAVTCAVVCH